MRTPSIDFFHGKIEGAIRLAQSYTEINSLAFIIKSCRLKPYSMLYENYKWRTILHRSWLDEFGNSLNIKGKKIDIIYNDLKLNKKPIVCSDIYYNLSLNKIAKLSKMLYIFKGKDEDLYQDCYLISFLGEDNFLRSYLYLYGEWEQVSPLIMGESQLDLFFKNIDLKFFIKINYKDTPIPCLSPQGWISSLPISLEFREILKENCEDIIPILDMK